MSDVKVAASDSESSYDKTLKDDGDSSLEESPKFAELSMLEDKKLKQSPIFSIICCGFALISDGLQNNIMSLTNVIFLQIFGPLVYTGAISTQLSNSLTVGTIVGQLAIGLICDLYGRKSGVVISTSFIVLGVILCTAAHGAMGSVTGFFWFFTIARGITGVGVGGEYPSSSMAAVEAANTRNLERRGMVFILVTNLMLSLGGPLANVFYLIVYSAGGQFNLNALWRVVFGISCIPPLAVFIFRMRMLNSELYRKSAIRKNVPYILTFKYYWRSLVGTAGAWFLYDFVVFPNGVFSGVIISSIVNSTGPLLIKETAQYQLLLGAIALPGCFVGALIVNRLGRRNLMMLGFTGYLIFGLSVGLAYDTVIQNVPLFIALYGLMTSFGNLGPGNCLGLVSAESYATPVRATLYGLSAAIGKVGAVAGNASFIPIRENLGARFTFIIAAGVGVSGVLCTYFFVRNDLERDLSDEDALFADYLAKNGWVGETGAENDHIIQATGEEGEKVIVNKSE